MTVSAQTPYVKISGAGTDGPFTVPFLFIASGDLVVVKIDADGVEATLTGNTITGAGNSSGGTVYTADDVEVGETLLIYRSTALTQPTDYTPNDAFPAEAHEGALDRLTVQAQEARRDIARTLSVPLGEAGLTLPDADGRAGLILAFDENGDIDASATLASITAAAASGITAGAIAAVEAAADLVLNEVDGTLTVALADAEAAIEAAADEVLDPVTGTLTTALADALDDVAAARDAAQVYHETWAGLNAIVGTTEGQSAKCFASSGTHTDPVVGGTVDDGGVYRWSTSPAGWKRLGDLSDDNASADAAAAAASATAAEAAAEYLPSAIRALVVTETVGNAPSYSGSTAAGNFTYVFPPEAEYQETLKRITFKTSSTTTFKIKKGTYDADTDTFTSAGDDLIITPGSAAEQTQTTADFGVWEREPGQVIAIFGNGSLVYTAGTGVPYYSISGDITTTGVDASTDTARVLAFEAEFEGVIPADTIQSNIAAVSLTNETRIGSQVTPATGAAPASNKTFVLNAQPSTGQRCSIIEVFPTNDGEIPYYRTTLTTTSVANDTKVRGAQIGTLTVVGGELNVFSAWDGTLEPFTLESNEYISFYDAQVIARPFATNGTPYWDASGDSSSFVDTTTVATVVPQITFRFHDVSPYGDDDKVELLREAVSGLLNPVVTTPAPKHWLACPMVASQSNGVGLGTGNNDAPPAGIAKMWKSTTNPWHTQVSPAGTLSDLSDPTGCETTAAGSMGPAFAQAVYDATDGQVGVIFINLAANSTSLTGNWHAAGTLRAKAEAHIALALAAIDAAGLNWSRGPVLMNIGEGNSADLAANTLTLAALDAAFDSVVTWIRTFWSANAKIVMTMTGTQSTGDGGTNTETGVAGWKAMRNRQRYWSETRAGVLLGHVSAKDFYSATPELNLMNGDGLHWGSIAQGQVGTENGMVVVNRCLGGG